MYIDYIRAYSNDPSVNGTAPPPRPDYRPAVTASAGTPSAIPPTPTITRNVTTFPYTTLNGTSGDDYFNTQYNQNKERFGFQGNDTYVITDERQGMIEFPNQGFDQFNTYDTDYLLTSNVENGKITGNPGGLWGNELANILVGSKGADVLIGGLGDDLLTGGGGNDSFLLIAGYGQDTITDYHSGVIIYLNGYAYSHSEIQQHLVVVGNNTVLTFDNGETLTLLGITNTSNVNLGSFNSLPWYIAQASSGSSASSSSGASERQSAAAAFLSWLASGVEFLLNPL